MLAALSTQSPCCPDRLLAHCQDRLKYLPCFPPCPSVQYCGIDRPSSWPPVFQVPGSDARAKPWGAWPEGPGLTVPQAPALITANTPGIVSSVGPGLFPGALSTNPALWTSALLRLYDGNASNLVINGEQLALLGFQFGSDSKSGSLYLEPAFQPVGGGVVVGTQCHVHMQAAQPSALFPLLSLTHSSSHSACYAWQGKGLYVMVPNGTCAAKQ